MPDAAHYLAYRPVTASSWAVIAAPRGEVLAGEAGALHFTLAVGGEYGLFLARAKPTQAGEPLTVTLDSTQSCAVTNGADPHAGYRWLESIGPSPVSLAAGPHTLQLDHAGGERARATDVAGFLLHPMIATRTFVAPDGAHLHLGFDLLLGQHSWEE